MNFADSWNAASVELFSARENTTSGNYANHEVRDLVSAWA
jgi:hypothetical protein